MFTTYKRQAIALLVGAILVVFLVGASAFGQASQKPSRSDAAWAQRLNQLAQSERAKAAWSARLMAQTVSYRQEQARVERANAAESLRLTKLAQYLSGPSDRANQAWSDRLTGLAEADAASK